MAPLPELPPEILQAIGDLSDIDARRHMGLPPRRLAALPAIDCANLRARRPVDNVVSVHVVGGRTTCYWWYTDGPGYVWEHRLVPVEHDAVDAARWWRYRTVAGRRYVVDDELSRRWDLEPLSPLPMMAS